MNVVETQPRGTPLSSHEAGNETRKTFQLPPGRVTSKLTRACSQVVPLDCHERPLGTAAWAVPAKASTAVSTQRARRPRLPMTTRVGWADSPVLDCLMSLIGR